jgi:hypothetical protein
LILSFLGDFFVEGNRGACPASQVAAALDDGSSRKESIGTGWRIG